MQVAEMLRLRDAGEGSDAEEDLDAKYIRLQAAAREADPSALGPSDHARTGVALAELPGWGDEVAEPVQSKAKQAKTARKDKPSAKRISKKQAAEADAAAAEMLTAPVPEIDGALSGSTPAGA